MVKHYVLQDGGKFTATCAKDFFRQLRESSLFNNDCTDDEFIRSFAGRIKIFQDADVPFSSAEESLKALIELGYVREV